MALWPQVTFMQLSFCVLGWNWVRVQVQSQPIPSPELSVPGHFRVRRKRYSSPSPNSEVLSNVLLNLYRFHISCTILTL